MLSQERGSFDHTFLDVAEIPVLFNNYGCHSGHFVFEPFFPHLLKNLQLSQFGRLSSQLSIFLPQFCFQLVTAAVESEVLAVEELVFLLQLFKFEHHGHLGKGLQLLLGLRGKLRSGLEQKDSFPQLFNLPVESQKFGVLAA